MTLALAAWSLIILRPWETDSLVPNLSVAPGLGVALGDSTEVASAPPRHLAAAGVAEAKRVNVVVKPAATPGRDQVPKLGISQGYAVSKPASVPIPAPPLEPAPSPEPIAAPPQPSPAPVPVSAPASTTTPAPVAGAGSGGSSPTMAGVGEPEPSEEPELVEVCAGEEIAVLVSFDPEEMPDGETEVEFVIRRLEGDEGDNEIRLEGKLNDVRSLILQLVAAGDCALIDGDFTGVEGDSQEVPASDPAATNSEATLEPELP